MSELRLSPLDICVPAAQTRAAAGYGYRLDACPSGRQCFTAAEHALGGLLVRRKEVLSCANGWGYTDIKDDAQDHSIDPVCREEPGAEM
jgi:hypothetical protein